MITRNAIVRGAEFQTREESGSLYIDGYFAVFNSPYWLWDQAYEVVDPDAFDLDADTDVRALTNHDTTLVLGRTTAGTLELRIDEKGLFGTITINAADQDAVNLYERVKRGDVTQCSFGFDILEQYVEYQDGAPTVWHILKVRLYEVSVVTFPAYKDTAVQARIDELDTIKEKKMQAWKIQMLARLKGDDNGT